MKNPLWLEANNFIVKADSVISVQFIPGSQSAEGSLAKMKVTHGSECDVKTSEVPISEEEFKSFVSVVKARCY